MATFRLKEKCGNHIGPPDTKGFRKTYKAGDMIISDDDLVEKWPSKFVLVSDKRRKSVATAPNIPVPSTKKKKKVSEKKIQEDMEEPIISESEHGIDVTAEFPTASKVDLKVFEKSKWYTVVDPDNNEVLNEKKLRQAKVESFLAEYEDDEDVEDVDTKGADNKTKDEDDDLEDDDDTDDDLEDDDTDEDEDEE